MVPVTKVAGQELFGLRCSNQNNFLHQKPNNMKQVFFFLLMSLGINAFATVRTVSNNPTSLAQFNTIQDAVNASSNGDTIYVQGSPTRYAGFTIQDKRLTIIGPGWAPAQNFQPYKAIMETNININGAGSRKTELQGLSFFSTVSILSSAPDSLRFIRNQFESAIYLGFTTVPYSGWVFEGNWFDRSFMSLGAQVFVTNFLFQNNVFYAISTNGNLTGFNLTQNVLFDHNVWFGPAGTSTAPCFGTASKGMNFTNNIFVHRNAATNNTNSVFNNNITYGAGTNNPWDASFGNSDAGGNIADQDPQMASQTLINQGSELLLLNFTIAAGPANNTGIDGKDMGLLFDASGSLNWSNCNMSRIPAMIGMNIFNPTITAGGTLNVQVDARRNN